jgi:hypothetical protein
MTNALDNQDRQITIGARCTVAYDTDIATIKAISNDGEYVEVEHGSASDPENWSVEMIEAYHIHLI